MAVHYFSRGRVRGCVAALACIVSCFAAGVSVAQPVEPTNGPKHVHPGFHALTGATVVTEPGEVLENATVVVREGVITRVGSGIEAPQGARVWDCSGLTIYAGLIEAYAPVEAPAPDSSAPGTHWNSMVMAERSALDGAWLNEKDREGLRKLGFAVAHIAPDKGVLRGKSAVVSLGEDDLPGRVEPNVIRRDVFDAAALEQNGWGSGMYPGSKMGAIALLRQTLADAQWYASATRAHQSAPTRYPRPEAANTLAALGEAGSSLPMLLDTTNELDILRTAKIAQEFGRRFVVVGSGSEYRRLDPIVELQARMVVPVTMAARPRVGTRGERDDIALRDLLEWEQSPTNLRRLAEAGVDVSMTSAKLRTKGEHKESFYKNVRRAIEAGLSEDDALAMLTTNPARLLGIQDRAGKVSRGMMANLVVVDGALFGEDAEIRDVWVDGRRYEINAPADDAHEGEWTVSRPDGALIGTLEIASKGVTFVHPLAEDAEVDAKPDKSKASKHSVQPPLIDLVFDAGDFGMEEGAALLVSGRFDGTAMQLSAELPNGTTERYVATRRGDLDKDVDESESSEDDAPDALAELMYPLGGYGLSEQPEQQDLIVRGATIWTSGPDGKIEDGVMIIRGGKIAGVWSADAFAESGVSTDGLAEIDASGKHVTAGLIDCHSHTGSSGGLNEGTQAVTSEVRVQDVINPDTVNFYRELAGGITTINQLHGSANPIGGQNCVVKLRWGVKHPDEMRFDGAPSGIKFALGENVKQSNWGDDKTTRYPQTRMGVETLIRDRFIAAREYAAASERARRDNEPLRRDLELEALAEILAGKRLVHCHSYRQDEILMLCRVAEEFGFKIGTFQHVLEGYKVAEAIKEHAIGGSAFSDWWAYKYEVIDAIPEAGAIMHEVGVCVSFNSDSDELARRMNTEAAKAIKYGGVEASEALKFVTLNPAIQLGIEDRVGSLEQGKDADFVIWSGTPLSSMTRAEQTWIDGRRYFSLEEDRAHRDRIGAERRRLFQKLLASESKSPGADKKADGDRDEMIDSPPDPRKMLLEMQYDYYVTNGLDPYEMRCGDCGCSIHDLFRRSN